MNAYFNASRFGLVLKKHWIENIRMYLLGIGALAGIMFIFFLLIFSMGRGIGYKVQGMVFIIGLFISGTIFTGILSQEISPKTKGINYVMFPASTLEKFLCLFLYATVFFFGIYIILFYMLDIPFVKLSEYYFPDKFNTIYSHQYPERRLFYPWSEKWHVALYWYFAIQSVFLLGSLYFEKFGFIKTVVAFMVFFALLFLLNYLMVNLLIAEKVTDALPYFSFSGDYVDVDIPGTWQKVFFFVGKFCMAPFFWIVAYIRLKEKQL